MYARACRIIINSPGFLPTVTGYGVPRDKIEVIPNGVDVEQIDPAERAPEIRAEWDATDRFTVTEVSRVDALLRLRRQLDERESSTTPA